MKTIDKVVLKQSGIFTIVIDRNGDELCWVERDGVPVTEHASFDFSDERMSCLYDQFRDDDSESDDDDIDAVFGAGPTTKNRKHAEIVIKVIRELSECGNNPDVINDFILSNVDLRMAVHRSGRTFDWIKEMAMQVDVNNATAYTGETVLQIGNVCFNFGYMKIDEEKSDTIKAIIHESDELDNKGYLPEEIMFSIAKRDDLRNAFPKIKPSNVNRLFKEIEEDMKCRFL